MPTFEEAALLDLSRVKLSDEVEEYKKVALHFMLRNGKALKSTEVFRKKLEDPKFYSYDRALGDTDYYACGINPSPVYTAEAKENFLSYGIDYKRSTDPAEEYGHGFTDTFSDPEIFTYLRCVIFSNSGDAYVFGLDFDEGFASLIIRLGEVKDMTLEDIYGEK